MHSLVHVKSLVYVPNFMLTDLTLDQPRVKSSIATCGLWLHIGQHSLRTLTNPPSRFFSKSHAKLSSRSEAPVSPADPLGNAAKSPALSQISQSWAWVETPCVSQQGEHRLTFTDSYPLRSQPLTYFTSICCH